MKTGKQLISEMITEAPLYKNVNQKGELHFRMMKNGVESQTASPLAKIHDNLYNVGAGKAAQFAGKHGDQYSYTTVPKGGDYEANLSAVSKQNPHLTSDQHTQLAKDITKARTSPTRGAKPMVESTTPSSPKVGSSVSFVHHTGKTITGTYKGKGRMGGRSYHKIYTKEFLHYVPLHTKLS